MKANLFNNSNKLKSIKFSLLITGTGILAVTASQAGTVTRADKFLEQGLSPFASYETNPTCPSGLIREYAWPEKIWDGAMSFLVMAPDISDIEDRQLVAIDLLRQLKDTRSYETLLRVSQFQGGYSSAVQLQARWALVDLMNVLDDEQRGAIVTSLEEGRKAAFEFNKLKNGKLGDIGKATDASFEELLSQARGSQEEFKGSLYAHPEQDLCALHWKEAGKEAAAFPPNVACGLIRTVLDNPLKGPTRLAAGIVSSLVSAVLDIPNNLAGAVTSGEYGNIGRPFGGSVANTIPWLCGIPKLRKIEVGKMADHSMFDWAKKIKVARNSELKSGISPASYIQFLRAVTQLKLLIWDLSLQNLSLSSLGEKAGDIRKFGKSVDNLITSVRSTYKPAFTLADEIGAGGPDGYRRATASMLKEEVSIANAQEVTATAFRAKVTLLALRGLLRQVHELRSRMPETSNYLREFQTRIEQLHDTVLAIALKGPRQRALIYGRDVISEVELGVMEDLDMNIDVKATDQFNRTAMRLDLRLFEAFMHILVRDAQMRGATHVEVSLDVRPDRIVINIADNRRLVPHDLFGRAEKVGAASETSLPVAALALMRKMKMPAMESHTLSSSGLKRTLDLPLKDFGYEGKMYRYEDEPGLQRRNFERDSEGTPGWVSER